MSIRTYYPEIKSFLISIGINVSEKEFTEETFLPGIRIENTGLAIDLSKLKYVGDMLHEAGHIACMAPSTRNVAYIDAGDHMGEEIAAQAWSYAAAVAAGVPLDIVFHKDGYKGSADWMLNHYKEGGTAGVPLLQWFDLTVMYDERIHETYNPDYHFPHMKNWLRQYDDPSQVST